MRPIVSVRQGWDQAGGKMITARLCSLLQRLESPLTLTSGQVCPEGHHYWSWKILRNAFPQSSLDHVGNSEVTAKRL